MRPPEFSGARNSQEPLTKRIQDGSAAPQGRASTRRLPSRALGTLRSCYFFALAPPISRSHLSNMATMGFASSGGSTGLLAIRSWIFRPSEFLDGVLALLRRHLERHVVDRRPRIHVAVVVHVRLLLRLKQIGDQLQQHVDLLSCGTPLGIAI